jgi:hypothetical protein
LVARLRPRWDAALGTAADVTGALVRNVGRGLPGVAGPLLIAYGLYEVYRPLGAITLGVFLLLLDRRV